MKTKIKNLDLEKKQLEILKMCDVARDAYYISSRTDIPYVTLNHKLNNLVSLGYLKIIKVGKRNNYQLDLEKYDL